MLTHTSLPKIKLLVLLSLQLQHIKCMQNIGGEISHDPTGGVDLSSFYFSQPQPKLIQDPGNTETVSGFVEPCDDRQSHIGDSFKIQSDFQIPSIEKITPEDVRQVSKFLSNTFPLNKQKIVARKLIEPINPLQASQSYIYRIYKDVINSMDNEELKMNCQIHFVRWTNINNLYSEFNGLLAAEMEKFLTHIRSYTQMQREMPEDLFRSSVTMEDLVYQIIHVKYQNSEISKSEVKKILSGNEHILANIMVTNYELKYGKFFTFDHEKGIECFFSSQFMDSDWQFSHYKSLVDVLKPREKRKFWWSAHQEFHRIYGGYYRSLIFSKNDNYHVLEFHWLPRYSKPLKRKSSTHDKDFSEIQDLIKELKFTFMDQNEPEILKRLHSFFDLQALERIYPGITIKQGDFNVEDYKKNMDSMSFACHHFQDTENIRRFIQYKEGENDAYGRFSIPSSFIRPKTLFAAGSFFNEKLIKYIQITLANADSKVSENDSPVIKDLFSDPIRNCKENTQQFLSSKLLEIYNHILNLKPSEN